MGPTANFQAEAFVVPEAVFLFQRHPHRNPQPAPVAPLERVLVVPDYGVKTAGAGILPVAGWAGFLGDVVVLGIAVFPEEPEERFPDLPVLLDELLRRAGRQRLDVPLPVTS